MLPTLSRLSVSSRPDGRLRHRCSTPYLRISPLLGVFRHPLRHSSSAVSDALPRLSRGLSHLTCQAAYTRFTPNNSEQRLHPLYYRGCWHRVSRCFLSRYRQALADILPSRQCFTIRRPSSHTRRCSIRLSPIVENSPLLPPVGVWTVSQFQCVWPSSQTRYPSLPWWAVTPPTS